MALIDAQRAEYIASEVQGLPPGEFTAAVRRWAGLLGCSVSTVNRAMRGAGVRRRKKSSRAGTCSVPHDDLLLLAQTISRTAKNKDDLPLMCVEDARDILVRSGVGSLGKVTPSTLSRLLRERGLSGRQVRELRRRPPRVAIKVDGVNKVHLFDASVCPQYFFGRSGLVFRQDLRSTAYKNKPKNVRALYTDARLVIRYGIIDAASDAFYIDYFEASGETAADAIEFLIAAWRAKSDPRFVFHGVPSMLVGDKGSATLKPGSPCFQFVANLGVRAITHAAGNPAAKGRVEQLMGWWERRFESRLALEAPRNVAALRAASADFQLHLQTTKPHSRHGMTRFEAWSRVEQSDLRELPRDERRVKEAVSYAPVSRVVSSRGVVRFAGREWRCPEVELYGERVLVYRDLWRPGRIEVVDACRPDSPRYVAEPLVKDGWGFAEDAAEWGNVKRLPDTAQQKAFKEALKVETPELKALGGWAEGEAPGNAAPMPREGDEVEPADVPVKRVGNGRARDGLRALLEERGLFQLTTEDWQVIDESWGEGGTVAETDIAAMAERLVAMRIAGGQAGGREEGRSA